MKVLVLLAVVLFAAGVAQVARADYIVPDSIDGLTVQVGSDGGDVSMPNSPITCAWEANLTPSWRTVPKYIKLDSTADCADIVPVHVTMTSCLQRGYHFDPVTYANVKCVTADGDDVARVLFKYFCRASPTSYDYRVWSYISASDATTSGIRERTSQGFITGKCY